LQVSNWSNPTVEGNVFDGGEGGGIVVHERARGYFCGNVLRDSKRAGVGVMDRASPLFVGNTMQRNGGGGVVMAGRCTPVFVKNVVSENGFVGFGVKESAEPLLQVTAPKRGPRRSKRT